MNALSNHYIDKQQNKLTVAPTVKVLFNETIHKKNQLLSSIFNKEGYLFGNYTIFDGIERIPPCTQLYKDKERTYDCFANAEQFTLEQLPEKIKAIGDLWPYDSRILPISSGLDSLLILSSMAFKTGFTYGPDNSPEIKIAQKYADQFENYLSYDFQQPTLDIDEKLILDEMSFGVLKPIPQLLTNYNFIKNLFHNASAFFDGYCGDAFQRGTFINCKGLKGELLKLWPWCFPYLGTDAKTILRRRHKSLSSDEFTLLFEDFLTKTEKLDLDDLQKVTWYEFLFGRGGRYAIFGSNVLAAQFFNIISPFSFRDILFTMIHQDYLETIKYKHLKKIWCKTANKYKREKVESGYSPKSSALFIPYIQLIYRALFHLIPSRANYGIHFKRNNKN